ncbi:hypothetical protein AFK24_09605 [Pseudomonas syringae]|uniref:Uncharacterized protein n=1 Tax=Pseudomonas syringae TaxID=317 RepID=A0A1C7ZAS9_PSESX|nr:hypothetical protein [Pseudomonas syringae]OCR25315.1 hypothetical protein AFK24_09605 [Pseudomonas syringae]
MTTNIYVFVRFFREERHRDSFLRGDLYMNRLRYFRDYEEKGTGNIGDQNEGVHTWLQPQDAAIIIWDEETGEEQRIDGFVAPSSISNRRFYDYHVYCMSALYLKDEDRFDSSEALQAALMPFLDTGDLGDYCVAIPAESFIERLESAFNADPKLAESFGHDLVSYYDPATFSGAFTQNDAIFMKQISYSHQREYRIYAYNNTTGADGRTINIGPLSDIATVLSKTELRTSLVLDDDLAMYIRNPA